jgi:hypothetical protein
MHSIGVFLGKKSEVDADSKITKKLDLGSDIVAILDYEDDHDIKIGKTIAYIRTDYFGGCGDQSANVSENGKEIYSGDTELGPGNPINEALKLLGVEKSVGNDEFDTIGLGRYRSNDDFTNEARAVSASAILITMQTDKGIWKISKGKGDRIYINCTDESKIMHPQELCGNNGLGMYGYEHLKDLAIAILRFEKEKQNSESIMSEIDS